MKTEGYPTHRHGVATKRFCRTLDLRNDARLIEEYRHRHQPDSIWPEIVEGIKAVGILEMEIYIIGNRLFMIVDTPLDFDWDKDMARLGSMPRQQEWEDYMSVFQQAEPGSEATDKWQLMERMFTLYSH